MRNKLNNKGFTLIELLIVIVIIGILVAVLIQVIDPKKQQNRARDAGVEATMNKIVLSTNGFNSAYGEYPDPEAFIGSLADATPVAGCVASGDACDFVMDNIPLAAASEGCNNYTSNTSGGKCVWRYQLDNGGADFSLYAQSYGIKGRHFKYDSTNQGKILKCSNTTCTE